MALTKTCRLRGRAPQALARVVLALVRDRDMILILMRTCRPRGRAPQAPALVVLALVRGSGMTLMPTCRPPGAEALRARRLSLLVRSACPQGCELAWCEAQT